MMGNNWKEINGRLTKEFKFKDFKEALTFINKVGEHAESIRHHPKIINVYSSVIIELWTHDKDAITDLDYALSGLIDEISL
jgi:4a-hydroxytetrahydrobiopterin dehydratase